MSEKSTTNLYHLLSQLTLKTDLRAELIGFSHEDWGKLKGLAENHSLLPLVYARLKGLGMSHDIPEDYLENMHQAYLTNAVRNALFLHEAKTVLQALNKVKIPVIALKGIYLLENIYPDISIRTMNDLDLMLKKKDIQAALSVCQSLGYQPTTYFDIQDANLDIKHVPPLKKEPGPYLELHWTILEEKRPFTIDVEGLWRRAVPAVIAGVDAFALSPEDLILHLCLHLAYQHHFNVGLRGLCDIAAVLRHFERQLDWHKLVDTAQAWGATRVLWLSVRLVSDVLSENVPSTLLESIQPAPLDPWVIEEARSQLESRGRTSSMMTPDLAKFATEKGFFSRIRLVWGRIFLPRRVLARLYDVPPTSLRILGCYFKRAAELVKQYRTSVKHILTEDTDTLVSAETQDANQQLKAWMAGSVDEVQF